MDAIRRFCDRVILLDSGRLVGDGDPATVVSAYRRLHAGEIRRPLSTTSDARPPRRRQRTPAGANRSPVVADLRQVADITRTLAASEFKVRYVDSILSYLWVMLGPLAFFAILYFVFTHIGDFDQGVEHYPIYLFTSLILWTYFATATTNAVSCLVRKEPLLRKLPLPHVAIPAAVVLTALFDLAMNSIALLFFLALAGVSPRLSWLELPLLVALLSVFVSGLAMMLAALYVRFRDVEQMWILARQALFYCSPIFYVEAALPGALRRVALVNPLAAVFTEARHALLGPSVPSAATALGGTLLLAFPLGVIALSWSIGRRVFERESPRVAENL